MLAQMNCRKEFQRPLREGLLVARRESVLETVYCSSHRDGPGTDTEVSTGAECCANEKLPLPSCGERFVRRR